MLGPGRYLLGVFELALLVGSAWLGATPLRRRALSDADGATAHLATAIIALAILLLSAELLGSFGLLEPAPYLAAVAVIGVGIGVLARGSCRRGGVPSSRYALLRAPGRVEPRVQAPPSAACAQRRSPHPDATRGRSVQIPTLIALVVATVAILHFAADVRIRLSTGMTGFDSTWYHGPFAAGFFQSGDTWGLHFIAPQFLAWFYPANSEVVHGVGMLAFGRDLLSPLLNLGWFVGCLVAAWCIGRPYRVAPWSMVLAAAALSVPALSDQAGEARNDIVGIFFLLSGVAILLAQRERSSYLPASGAAFALGPAALVGLSAGLAAGTKLNFLLPAAVLVVGIALIAPHRQRWSTFGVAALAGLAGGGYWYLRNLAHTGNPLPWVKHLGPITLPAPEQALGGREGHTVLGYLTDGSVWSGWFLPGLHHGLTILWPLLLASAIAAMALCLARRSDPALRVAALAGLAAGLAWLIAPTSASGPDGMPRGFESGLRYLAPVLALGLALVPVVLSSRLRRAGTDSHPNGRILKAPSQLARRLSGRGAVRTGLALAVFAAVAIGYPIQRHYLQNRYADPTFTAPGLNAAFKWAQGVEDARIATTSTRQYPLFGSDLSNRVSYIGEEQQHGGFTAPTTCRRWRELLNAGHYDYVVTSRDRIEPGKPPYPPTAQWTKAPSAAVVLREPPTIVYKLQGNLDPSACRVGQSLSPAGGAVAGGPP
jgi:hypothetical protein